MIGISGIEDKDSRRTSGVEDNDLSSELQPENSSKTLQDRERNFRNKTYYFEIAELTLKSPSISKSCKKKEILDCVKEKKR